MISLYLSLVFSVENNDLHYIQPEGCENRYFSLSDNNLELSSVGSKLGLVDCEQDWCELQTDKKENVCIDGVKFKKCDEENKEKDRFKLVPVEKNFFQITAKGKVTDFKNKCFIIKSCSDKTVFLGKCGEKGTIDKFKFVNKVELPEVNVSVSDRSKYRVEEEIDKDDKNTKNIIIERSSSSESSSTCSDDYSDILVIKERPKIPVKRKFKEIPEDKKQEIQKKKKSTKEAKTEKPKDEKCVEKKKKKKKIPVPMKNKDISVEQLGIDDSIDKMNQLTSDIKSILNCNDADNHSHPDCKVVDTDIPYSKDHLNDIDSHPEYTKVSVKSYLKSLGPGTQLYKPNIYNGLRHCIDSKPPISMDNPKPEIQILQGIPLCSALNDNIKK